MKGKAKGKKVKAVAQVRGVVQRRATRMGRATRGGSRDYEIVVGGPRGTNLERQLGEVFKAGMEVVVISVADFEKLQEGHLKKLPEGEDDAG